MLHRDYIIILKILKEINIGFELLGEMKIDEFLNDEKIKRAVGMTVINIGELVKNITQETRIKYPNVQWKAIAGLRDIAAHRYQTLRMEDVYYTMKDDFSVFKNQLEEILKKEGLSENGKI